MLRKNILPFFSYEMIRIDVGVNCKIEWLLNFVQVWNRGRTLLQMTTRFTMSDPCYQPHSKSHVPLKWDFKIHVMTWLCLLYISVFWLP